MTAETEKEGPLAQDDTLLGKITTLYREADELSVALEPSSSVKSQDVTRLPIIGSLPVKPADKQSTVPNRKDNAQPLSPIIKTDMMSNIVLTGIISSPGSESGHDGTIPLANKHLEKSFPSPSSEDPFIAIRNAVEIAGRSDKTTHDSPTGQPAKKQKKTQTSDLAHVLAEIIKQQIDNAIETRMANNQRPGETQTSENSDNAVSLKKNLVPKQVSATSTAKKTAKIAHKTQNPATTSKPTKRTRSITKTSSKNTRTSEKPARKHLKNNRRYK